MSADLLRKALEYLEGIDPLLRSGGQMNHELRDEIRARLSQAGAGGGVVRAALLEAREYAPRRDGIVDRIDAALAAFAPSPSAGEPVARRDVLAERRRQIEAEGWTPEHDDEHASGEMALAAACYVMAPGMLQIEREWTPPDRPKEWPWHHSWWKPGFRRRNLVKAAALLIAEIERLDRKEVKR